MKSTLGDKLAASVRETKQQQAAPAKPAVPPAKPAESEPPIKPLPARRVWPD
ncbi:MAG: hypothetical protein AB1810_01250 [Pseudomonadota bacterium]